MVRWRRKETFEKGNNAMAIAIRYKADDPGFLGRLAHHAPGMDDVLLSRSGPPKHQPGNFRQHARGPRNQYQRLQYRTDDISRVLSGRRAPWRLDQQEGRTIPLHAGSDRALGRNLDGTGGYELSLEFLVAEGTLGVGSRRLHPRNGVLSDNDVSYVRSLTDRWLDSLPVVLYKSSELSIRMSWFYTGIPLTQAWGSLLAGSILEMRGINGWGGWQWLYGSTYQCGRWKVADSEAGSFWKA